MYVYTLFHNKLFSLSACFLQKVLWVSLQPQQPMWFLSSSLSCREALGFPGCSVKSGLPYHHPLLKLQGVGVIARASGSRMLWGPLTHDTFL